MAGGKNSSAWLILLIVMAGSLCAFVSMRNFKPPGTQRITANFFADETEVENLAWREYEWWTRKTYGDRSPEHLATLPDTTVWLNPAFYNAPYTTYYYRHKAYDHYPVVGISYEQAQAFCAWRSQRVKDAYQRRYRKPISLAYRLPSRAEWETLAASDSAIATRHGRNSAGDIAVNCRREADSIAYAGQADVTAPVFSYRKNKLGLFQCLGNVAEMVAEKNICKGGSWNSKPSDCAVGNDETYTKTASWLGFRCVCDVN